MNNKQQLTNSKQYQAIKQAYTAYKQEQEDIRWSVLALQAEGLTVEQVISERLPQMTTAQKVYTTAGNIVAMILAAGIMMVIGFSLL